MKLIVILVLLLTTNNIITLCHAITCSSFAFYVVYSECLSLPVLDSALHWNYHEPNSTVDIAFRHRGTTATNWVAWALNIDGTGMVGAQSLVAFRDPHGHVSAYTSPITWYGTQLEPGPLSFRVSEISAEFSGGEMVIFASLELPAGRTRLNQVWQTGPVSGSVLRAHSLTGDNIMSSGSIDFVSGQPGDVSEINSLLRRRHVHGILNTVSWGILMPIGAMIARYLKVFKLADPAWFYLHVGCQTTAYFTGVAGWATGLKLSGDSPGVTHHTHRNIGITLFCLGTLQVLALIIRPKPDHKYRIYWSMYHRLTGYAVIILSMVNVYEGLNILDDEKDWKTAYTAIVIFLVVTSGVLEGITRHILRNRESFDDKKANP